MESIRRHKETHQRVIFHTLFRNLLFMDNAFCIIHIGDQARHLLSPEQEVLLKVYHNYKCDMFCPGFNRTSAYLEDLRWKVSIY
jgi:hypothetical protein